MKSFMKVAIISTAVLVSANATAKRPSDNQLLTQCKTTIKEQISDAQKVKMTKLRNRRGTFEASFKVTTDNDSGVYACTIVPNGSPILARVDKSGERIAMKQ